MMTPLVAPMVILPATRSVFLGWLKTYISVALGPLFAFAERLALAIPWSAWIGSGDGAIDGWDLLTNIVQVHARRLQHPVLLCVLVDTDRQLLINLIVSGASRPFRML